MPAQLGPAILRREKTIRAEPQIVCIPAENGRKRPKFNYPVPPAPLQPWPKSHDQRPRVGRAFLYFMIVPCRHTATHVADRTVTLTELVSNKLTISAQKDLAWHQVMLCVSMFEGSRNSSATLARLARLRLRTTAEWATANSCTKLIDERRATYFGRSQSGVDAG
jgi:hypothetical protein